MTCGAPLPPPAARAGAIERGAEGHRGSRREPGQHPAAQARIARDAVVEVPPSSHCGHPREPPCGNQPAKHGVPARAAPGCSAASRGAGTRTGTCSEHVRRCRVSRSCRPAGSLSARSSRPRGGRPAGRRRRVHAILAVQLVGERVVVVGLDSRAPADLEVPGRVLDVEDQGRALRAGREVLRLAPRRVERQPDLAVVVRNQTSLSCGWLSGSSVASVRTWASRRSR